ncbi:MAG: metallophosphoesterase [Nanoarchaeota archaeon]
MKIAHLADIQIRFGSRHDEYRQVFDRLYDDLKKQKPDRIYIAGDLVHHKINMSPGSFNLLAEFLINLSRIAPTDVILGNHDLNLQQLEQGDAISPIFYLANLIEDSKEKKAYIVTNENKKEIDFGKKAVYYYPDSGFYDVHKDIVYGIFSCKDDEIITLEKKDPNKKYIAMYHGTVYGARMDNGYEDKRDNLMRLSTFSNFDMVMLGDIHEYQTFRDDESVAYPGSLIQQNFGESIDKGYLLWNTKDCSHERKFILNDYGFAKIDVARGEDVEERVEYVKFSNNKKKTKVYIIWEDYEENYSIEKENQIKRLVKDKYGCESVRVEFKEIRRDIANVSENDETRQYTFEEIFKEWVKEGEFNIDEEMMTELLEFSREVDTALEIDESHLNYIDDWDLNSIEISNILSFDKKPIKIDFDKITGLTGIFGKNFNGKSNVVKAIVWGLYKEIIGGNQSSSKYLVNIYTDSDSGYVIEHLTINGEKYRIIRKITSKNGKNTFNTSYERLIKEYDDDGNFLKEEWKDKLSDKKTGEQKEVQELVKDAIGIFEDFTKTSLQAQGGSGDYISQEQQPKNNLISRFLGLESYKDRHEYANKFFNDVKRKQKDLGNAIEIEDKIKEIDVQITDKQKELDSFKEEKRLAEIKQNDVNDEIIELTKNLEKIENPGITSIEIAESQITALKTNISTTNSEIKSLEDWLSKNFKKELPFSEGETIESLSRKIENEKNQLRIAETNLSVINNFIANNPKKPEINVSSFSVEIDSLKKNLLELNSKLPTHQGKCCPTCGHVQQKADPEKEEMCLHDIKIAKELIEYKEKKIKENDNIVNHNKKVDDSKQKVEIAEQSISIKKESIKLIEDKKSLIENSKDIVEHNKTVDTKSKELKDKKVVLESDTKKLQDLMDKVAKFIANKDKVKKNLEIQEKISEKKDLFNAYKLSVFNLDKNINVVFGEIKVFENNKSSYGEKLSDIKNSERLFKKYSIYLQAVHRDGIPAAVIRKKLPIINSKINSILSEVVDFKIELEILSNGDIIETFFFSEDKCDALPLASASGSQKFIASIVITEALRYMSRLTKPSLRIIDEGFGTLDDELTMGVVNILNYLRNKYKNVLIITHRNEIKDFADNIIEVTKIADGLSPEVLANNPKAGLSKITIT